MNRMEEWNALRAESTPPECLAGTAARAASRAAKRRHALWGAYTGGGVAVVLLVNASAPFAMAVGKLPILGDIAREFAYNDSIRTALEHDYVQLVQRQVKLKDGTTISLEYLIADRQNLILFYKADSDRRVISPRLAGDEVSCLSWSGQQTTELQHAEFVFTESEVPEEISVIFEAETPAPDGGRSGVEETAEIDRIRIAEEYRAEPRTIELNQVLDILGQPVIIDRVTMYPTQTRVDWHQGEDSTGLITSMSIHMTDSKGNEVVKSGGGLVGFGGADSGATTILDTVWWDETETYTLEIDRAAVRPDAYAEVTYDPETGLLGGLPPFIRQEKLPPNEFGGDYDTRLVIHCICPSTLGSFLWWPDAPDKPSGECIWQSGSMSWRADGDIETEDPDAPGTTVNLYRLSDITEPTTLEVQWWPDEILEKPIEIELQ